MIVIAIIGILAAIAVPQYTTYLQRTSYLNVSEQVNTAKSAMEVCLQLANDTAGCDTDIELLRHGFKKSQIESLPFIDTITISENAGDLFITVTPADNPTDMAFLTSSLTYIKQPVIITTGTDSRVSEWITVPTSGCAIEGICE